MSEYDEPAGGHRQGVRVRGLDSIVGEGRGHVVGQGERGTGGGGRDHRVSGGAGGASKDHLRLLYIGYCNVT